MTPKQKTEAEDMPENKMTDEELAEAIVDGISASLDDEDEEEGTAVARKVFSTTTPTLEMIFGCHKRVFCYEDEDDQEIVIDELIESVGIAQKVPKFTKPAPLPWEVFWVYDEAYDDND